MRVAWVTRIALVPLAFLSLETVTRTSPANKKYFSIPCGKFGSPYMGKTTAAARAALPIPTKCVQYSVCPNNGMCACAWDYCRVRNVYACDCTRGLYGHCRKRVCTESGLGNKPLTAPGNRTRICVALGFSVLRPAHSATLQGCLFHRQQAVDVRRRVERSVRTVERVYTRTAL